MTNTLIQPEQQPLDINVNISFNNKFTVNIIKFPNLEMNIQKINLPGISYNNSPERFTGDYRDYRLPGDKIQLQELGIEFIVDENFENWRVLYTWILNNIEADPYIFSDCILSYYNNNYYLSRRIHITEAFPFQLSGLDFETGQFDNMKSKVSFYFKEMFISNDQQ